MHVSYDVLFYEHIFPYKDAKSPFFSTPFTHVTDDLLLDENLFESNHLLPSCNDPGIDLSHVSQESEPSLQATDQSHEQFSLS